MIKRLLFFVVTLLSIYAQAQESFDAKALVLKHSAEIMLTENNLDNFIVSSSYYDAPDNIQRVYLLQRYRGLPVYNQVIVLAFREDKLIYKSGLFVEDMANATGNKTSTPLLKATDAINVAFIKTGVKVPASLPPLSIAENGRKINYGTVKGVSEDVTAELLWVPVVESGNLTIKLAWQIQVAPDDKADWWFVQIDALNGTLINKENITVSDNWNLPENPFHVPAVAPLKKTNDNKPIVIKENREEPNSPFLVGSVNYLVIPFPAESPVHPGGTAAIRTNPWTATPGTATSLGWHNDGASDYTITRGNNVWATEDRAGSNGNTIITPTGIPATSTTSPDPLNFNFPPDFAADPTGTNSASNNFRQFATTNLFYWNNIMHDIAYQYGFNEPAGNFQANNQGRGGAGSDYVIALAQSAAAGSIGNNANFATPGDGGRPRMRMYLFDPVPVTTLTVNTPGSIAGNYGAIESGFSTANKLSIVGPVSGQVVFYNDDAGGTTHYACGAPVNSVAGKIALILRGFGGTTCPNTVPFTTKALNAQTAGAIAVIVINNVAGTPIVMGGTDNTITIPAVMISDVDGAILSAQVSNNLTVTLSSTPAVALDGDLDAGIMCHEYGHGISNRLTAGPANVGCLGASATGCANTRENGSEGWSDYFGLMMTTDWSTAQLSDGGISRGVGAYVVGLPINGPGIRLKPYSTNLAINPATYANVGDAAYCSEIHNIGEVWCSAIWDMTWSIIQQQGSINPDLNNFNTASTTGGNSIALKLVLEGMKLQPCTPGFIDSRNAILAADVNLYGGVHTCAIWNAFARRGMGWSANQGSSNSCIDQTVAFDLPPAPSITTHPASIAVCAGANATFTVVATGGNLSYNWQVSTNGGATWNNVSPANTTTSLTITGVTGSMNGNQYRNVVTGGCPLSSINSNAAILTINTSAPVITTQPASITVCEGTAATFTVAAEGTNTFNWQVSTNGGASWSNVAPAVTTPTLTLTNVTAAMNNYQYRSVVTGGCSGTLSVNSNTATLTVNSGSFSITGHPSNITVCAGLNAVFNVTATGTGLTYRWQVSTNGGANWNDITPAATTNTLTLNAVTASMNNNQYRSIVNGPGGCTPGGVISNAATLTVNTAPVITTQPQDATLCAGSAVSFTVAAGGSGISYQWHLSTDGGNNYNPITGATNATFSISTISAGMNGNRYRSVVTGSCSPAEISAAALLTVQTSVNVTTQPVNVVKCDGENASFTVAGSGTGIIYIWQYNTGSGFVNIPAGAPYSGVNTATLTITGVTPSMNNYQFRSLLSNASCTTPGTSNTATLTVNSLPSVTANPVSVSICTGSNATFTVAGAGTGITYKWQVSTTAVPAFTDIPLANSSSYTVANATVGMNGNQYRSVISGTCPSTVVSSPATLTVANPVTVTSQPVNSEKCSGSDASFTVAGSSNQAINYQWQVSSNGGTTWTNISGATSAMYTISGVTTSLNGNMYRALLFNAICTTPAMSLSATLIVRQLPSVTLSPTQPVLLLPGQTATLTAVYSASTGGTFSTTWTRDNNPIPVTGNTYDVTVANLGAYQVRLQESWPGGLVCANQSQTVTIGAAVSTRLFIYPSPNDGNFIVSYYNSGTSGTQRQIIIYDSKGSKAFDKQFTVSGPYTLIPVHMETSARGIYYLVIGDTGGKKLAEGKVHIR